ncbi:F0F1 ATP synthase subunit A [Intestinibacillus massiliensis]|uniref:F0F1 ATP synthase subunit A n=1 Tax=Intestinibacillus massiliensis TaxID=1871029 RepID=UPI001D094E41|nr:FoF1 ATP synthase subunit a [Intestinibacillus massiliensis]MCB6364835.1 F0F1 ATP synthase subunit A [Intestinibacillus massiliensis]
MGDIAINGPRVLFEIPILGGLPITETMRNAWIVMLFILCLCLFLTSRMEKVPKGKQAIAEKAVQMIDNLVDGTMGPGCRGFSPYIATLLMFSFCGSLASLFFMRPVTGDLNTTLGWALITFVLIIVNNIKYKGVGGYLKGFLQPIFVMAPLNVLSEVATPVSMSFRHFGNIAGGLVITTLLLAALKALSGFVLGFLPVPLLQIGIPGVLSLYFDVFTSAMQAFIFSMLTMSYVGNARSAD